LRIEELVKVFEDFNVLKFDMFKLMKIRRIEESEKNLKFKPLLLKDWDDDRHQ
jgi:hypothetical protein